MFKLLLYSTFIFGIISCSQKPSNDGKKYSPISEWLIINEDSLANQFGNFLSKQDSKQKNGSQLLSSEWVIEDSSLLGILSKKIELLDSNIEFTYQYLPQSEKTYALHISSDKKRSTIKNVDSIFNDIDSLKHFTIIKYNPPGKEFSKFIGNVNGKEIIIDPHEIGFKLINHNTKYTLSCFYTNDIPKEMQENLVYDILGEEVILKEIDTIMFFKESYIDKSMLSIKSLRRHFDIKN